MLTFESPEAFWCYPPDLAVLPRARHQAKEFLRWAGVNEPCAMTAVLVANELIIDSITQARTDLVLCVGAQTKYVRVAVQDLSPPSALWSGPGPAIGRLPLTIANELADRVLFDYRSTGKTISATVARHDPARRARE